MSTELVHPLRHLRVLSLNMHKGLSPLNRKLIIHELSLALQQEKPDLVFLQEVQGLHQHRARRFEHWPSAGQADFIAESMAFRAVYGGNAYYTHGHHGNAILSHLPIITWRNTDISHNRLEQRGILHAELSGPSDSSGLHALCVHLNLLAGGRRWQLKRLREEIECHVPPDAPLVVAGDFNDWRNDARQILVEEFGLQEVFETLHGKPARSFPARLPLMTLDRIYVRNLSVTAARIGQGHPWKQLSDHAPLMAELSY